MICRAFRTNIVQSLHSRGVYLLCFFPTSVSSYQIQICIYRTRYYILVWLTMSLKILLRSMLTICGTVSIQSLIRSVLKPTPGQFADVFPSSFINKTNVHPPFNRTCTSLQEPIWTSSSSHSPQLNPMGCLSSPLWYTASVKGHCSNWARPCNYFDWIFRTLNNTGRR